MFFCCNDDRKEFKFHVEKQIQIVDDIHLSLQRVFF